MVTLSLIFGIHCAYVYFFAYILLDIKNPPVRGIYLLFGFLRRSLLGSFGLMWRVAGSLWLLF